MILVIPFIVSACSSIDIHPEGNFIDLTKFPSQEALAIQSKNYFMTSKVDDHVPNEHDRNNYFSGLESNIAFRNYLFFECARLFNREHKLDLQQPVYVSAPKWNNTQNWFATVFNFQVSIDNTSKEVSMECDVNLDKTKQVSEYQLKKSYTKLIKNE